MARAIQLRTRCSDESTWLLYFEPKIACVILLYVGEGLQLSAFSFWHSNCIIMSLITNIGVMRTIVFMFLRYPSLVPSHSHPYISFKFDEIFLSTSFITIDGYFMHDFVLEVCVYMYMYM